MAKGKTRKIRGVLMNVSSERVQYKPYNYGLTFGLPEVEHPVLVEVDVPEDTVVEAGKDFVVINLDGLKAILSQTADKIDELNQEYMKEVRRG